MKRNIAFILTLLLICISSNVAFAEKKDQSLNDDTEDVTVESEDTNSYTLIEEEYSDGNLLRIFENDETGEHMYIYLDVLPSVQKELENVPEEEKLKKAIELSASAYYENEDILGLSEILNVYSIHLGTEKLSVNKAYQEEFTERMLAILDNIKAPNGLELEEADHEIINANKLDLEGREVHLNIENVGDLTTKVETEMTKTNWVPFAAAAGIIAVVIAMVLFLPRKKGVK